MNYHLCRHLVHYASHRGPLWAYSCFAYENLNGYIKRLVHGTHHAIDQITCALGLYYGLHDYATNISDSQDVPKSASSILSKLLTNKNTAKKGKSVKVPGGCFPKHLFKTSSVSKEAQSCLESYLGEGFVSDNACFYTCFESDNGFQVTSMAHKRCVRTESSVVSYTTEQGNASGQVDVFVLYNKQGYAIIRMHKDVEDKILQGVHREGYEDQRISKLVNKYHISNLVPNYQLVEPTLGNFVVIPVASIENICVLMDILDDFWVISHFPNAVEPN